MSNKIIDKLLTIFIGVIFAVFSYLFCYYFAEKYFFDKIFYQKSISHGYKFYKTPLQKFGQRGKYLQLINDHINSNQRSNIFTIAVYGDSYVWGLGIKNSELFTTILQKKLNKIKPTNVINIGEMGANFLDYYTNYHKLISQTDIDLNIFILVSNDAFINKSQNDVNESSAIINMCQRKFPNSTISYEVYDSLISFGISPSKLNSDYYQDLIYKVQSESWNNSINRCVIDYTSNNMPISSLYFITDNYDGNSEMYQQYHDILAKNGKYIIDSNIGKNIEKYRNYFSNIPQAFQVSNLEKHPNKIANQLYAELLYQEIINNPKWDFINQN